MEKSPEKGSAILKWIDFSSDAGGVISAACLLMVSIIIVYEVIVRYLFNSPTTWVLEMSVYLSIAIGLLGAAYALKNNSHFSITFATDKLSLKNQKRMKVLTSAAGIVYSTIFIYEGINMVQFSYEMEDASTGMMATPLWIPGLLIPLGGLLLTLQFLKKFIDELAG